MLLLLLFVSLSFSFASLISILLSREYGATVVIDMGNSGTGVSAVAVIGTFEGFDLVGTVMGAVAVIGVVVIGTFDRFDSVGRGIGAVAGTAAAANWDSYSSSSGDSCCGRGRCRITMLRIHTGELRCYGFTLADCVRVLFGISISNLTFRNFSLGTRRRTNHVTIAREFDVCIHTFYYRCC